MKVIEVPNGRLGNGIFRYLASILLQIKYGAERIYNNRNIHGGQYVIINDDNYSDLLISIEKNREWFSDIIIILDGYFQFDIYCEELYKSKIIQFIKDNKNDIIHITDLNHNYMNYNAGELMNEPNNIRKYDIVIHLRLEDFMNANIITHPTTYIKLINEIYSLIKEEHFTTPSATQNFDYEKPPIAAIVCNQLTTEDEKKYIQYIYDNNNTPIKLIFESNDVITDFHIMKNARILVCSLSTLSWCASLLSEKVKTVYVPNNKSGHQTFSRPTENTILYDNIYCDKNYLNLLYNQS